MFRDNGWLLGELTGMVETLTELKRQNWMKWIGGAEFGFAFDASE